MGPGAVLRLIRESGGITRNELIERTGLGRSTVSQRVDALLGSGLVRELQGAASTGGRRPTVIAFNPDAGLVLSGDLGATHARLAVANLSGEPLHEEQADIRISEGPDRVLPWLADRFTALLADSGRPERDLWAVGIGVPGPVEFVTGHPVSPPIMPGWDGVDIPGRLRRRFDVPVLVDNDVNIMALGEHWKTWPATSDLLLVKVGTGIGCGIVAKGQIHRGAQGAAGDIGHIRITDRQDVVCECGNLGCLEAVAGGRALVRALNALGRKLSTSRDVVALVRGHDVDAVRLVRQAGRDLGSVLATLVNVFNPEVIVIAGEVAEAQEQLFAGVREIVYQRSTALATRSLQIVPSRLGERAGVIGAAGLAAEHILSPHAVDRRLVDLQTPDVEVRRALPHPDRPSDHPRTPVR